MRPLVEPIDGAELDRLITALLNATGVVHQLIESAKKQEPGGGLDTIAAVSETLRDSLALLTEHRSDETLAVVTNVLAEATLLTASDLGMGHVFGLTPNRSPGERGSTNAEP